MSWTTSRAETEGRLWNERVRGLEGRTMRVTPNAEDWVPTEPDWGVQVQVQEGEAEEWPSYSRALALVTEQVRGETVVLRVEAFEEPGATRARRWAERYQRSLARHLRAAGVPVEILETVVHAAGA